MNKHTENNIIRLFALLTLFIGTFLNLSAAVDGDAIIESVAKRIESAPSITTEFVLIQDGNSLSGEMVMSKNCFCIVAPTAGYSTWFDGKTQWTWQSSTDEVSMFDPSEEELMETNPLSLMNTVKSNYKVAKASDDGANYVLTLKPVANSKVAKEVSEVTLKISKNSNFPQEVTVKYNNKQVIGVTFNNVTIGKTIDSKKFRYQQSYHPEAEIIDLR